MAATGVELEWSDGFVVSMGLGETYDRVVASGASGRVRARFVGDDDGYGPWTTWLDWSTIRIGTRLFAPTLVNGSRVLTASFSTGETSTRTFTTRDNDRLVQVFDAGEAVDLTEYTRAVLTLSPQPTGADLVIDSDLHTTMLTLTAEGAEVRFGEAAVVVGPGSYLVALDLVDADNPEGFRVSNALTLEMVAP